jgi:hypothetical protein
MTKNTLVDRLKGAGRLAPAQVTLWRDAAELFAAADAIGREGSSVVIKVDGARKDGSVYTVVISGGRLSEEYFRKDGPDLTVLLVEAVTFYDGKVWSAGPSNA